MQSEKTVGLSFRVTPGLKRMLEAAAAYDRRTLTNMLEVLVEDFCKRHGIHSTKAGGTESAINTVRLGRFQKRRVAEQIRGSTEIHSLGLRLRSRTMAETEQASSAELALIDLAVDSWKFARLFIRVISKLDAGEQSRYANQMRFFQKRVDVAAEIAGAKLVSIEGMPFEPGAAATPLNLSDFDDSDRLFVDQMLEPIVMGADGVLRMGTVMLRKL